MPKFEGGIDITPDNNEPSLKDVMDSAEEIINENPEKEVEVTRRLPGEAVHIGITEEKDSNKTNKEKSEENIEDNLGIDRIK